MSSHPLQRSGDAYGRRLAFITKERPSIRMFGIRELWARSHLEWDDDGKACFEALQAFDHVKANLLHVLVNLSLSHLLSCHSQSHLSLLV
jgi:hypothetical protein